MNKQKGRRNTGRKNGRSRRNGFESDGQLVPGGLDRITRQNGKFYLNLTTASNSAQTGLSPFLDPRLAILAAQYELYRFVWVKFTIHPSDNATSNELAIGFLPDRPTATGSPASFAEMLELAYSKYMAAREIEPVWLAIKAAGLLGRTALKWWDTDTIASESTVQGRIFLRTAQAIVTLNCIVEYEVEFTNPIPATVTFEKMLRLKELGYLDRREKVSSGQVLHPTLVGGGCTAKQSEMSSIRCACGGCARGVESGPH